MAPTRPNIPRLKVSSSPIDNKQRRVEDMRSAVQSTYDRPHSNAQNDRTIHRHGNSKRHAVEEAEADLISESILSDIMPSSPPLHGPTGSNMLSESDAARNQGGQGGTGASPQHEPSSQASQAQAAARYTPTKAHHLHKKPLGPVQNPHFSPA